MDSLTAALSVSPTENFRYGITQGMKLSVSSGGHFGDGGVTECFLPTSACLKDEGQDEGTTGLFCVYCRVHYGNTELEEAQRLGGSMC